MASKKRVFFLFFSLIFAFSYAQSDLLSKAWENFNNNKRNEAIASFIDASKDNNSKAMANLGLSIVYADLEKYDEAFTSFLEFYNNHPNPNPYAYALWTSGGVFKDYERKNQSQIKFLERLTTDTTVHGTLKSMSWYMLGKHYQAINKFNDSKKCFEKIGAIENWQSVGTFENISESGFNKNWGVLEHPESDASFKNKVEANVSWFNINQLRNDKWLDFDYHYGTSNSIIYAQTFLNSEVAFDAYLLSGCSGSIKIWVNDILVTNIEEERNCDMDVYTSMVKFNKGSNRILLQIGASEINSSNFLIRITDKKGNNIKGIKTSQKFSAYEKTAPYKAQEIEFWGEQFFKEKIKSSPNEFINYVLLASTYLRNDKSYEAKKLLQKTREFAPNSTFIGQKLIEAYNRDGNDTKFTKEQKRILDVDSLSIFSLVYQINDKINQANYDEQEIYLKKLEDLYGINTKTKYYRLGLLENRKQMDNLGKLADEMFKENPNDFDIMQIKYVLMSQEGKDLSASNKFLNQYLKNNFNDKVYVTLAQNYFKLGDKYEALNIFTQRSERMPYAIGYVDDMTDIYMSLKDYSSALVWAKKALEFAPYLGFYWDKLGKVYQEMNDTEKAKEAFKKAIYYQPTNYSARELLRKLEGKPGFFDSFAKEDVYKMYKSSPKAEDFPDDNSMILLNDVQRVVYPEGGTEKRTEIVIKVFNKKGIENWKEYYVGYNSYSQGLVLEKAEVLKADGSKVQAEANENHIVFTNLSENDAIHLAYKINDFSSGKLSKHFLDEHNFNLYYPIGTSRYSLITPKELKFNKVERSLTNKSKTKDLENFVLEIWEEKNLPAVKSEATMPPLDDIGMVLELGTIPNWDFVANWYSDISSTKAKSDYEVKEEVAELFKGKTSLNEYQKAKLIYEYIQQNIRYSNVAFRQSGLVPQKASKTISTNLGDCKDLSTLFVAMCAEVGIKANLVLINTRDNGEKDFSIPCIGFNHCISTVNLDGKKYTLELTDNNLSFCQIPYNDLNGTSLLIPRNSGDKLEGIKPLVAENRNPNTISRDVVVDISGSDMIIDRKVTKIGPSCSATRYTYANIGKEKQEKKLTESISSDFSNPVKLISLAFGDLKKLSDTVTYKYSFKVTNQVKEIVGLKIFNIPWTDSYSNLGFVSLDERKYPYNLWDDFDFEMQNETVTINLPKGKVLAEVPKSISYTCNAYDYSLNYKILPEKIIATRTIKLKKDVVSPAEYVDFKEFCKKVSEADGKQIGFK